MSKHQMYGAGVTAGAQVLALVLGAALFFTVMESTTRANVYATNLKLNGGSTNNITIQPGGTVRISYILNEPALLGALIQILQETNLVANINVTNGLPGTLLGTNTVDWDGTDTNGNVVPPGAYSVSVTVASSGYSVWTPITDDNNPGNFVYAPSGIAVDRNPGSPYYGRVFVANSHDSPQGGFPGSQPGDNTGILKWNADASPAEEGAFTTGGHAWAGDFFSPWKLRVSVDDFVYINDFSLHGDLYRWDARISTNSQLQVLRSDNRAAGAILSGPAVAGSGTNTQIWMADTHSPSLGIIKYIVGTNGACALNDVGTEVVGLGGGTNLTYYPNDVALDTNGNIYTLQFASQAGDPASRVLSFPAYTPATNQNLVETTATWAVGAGLDSFAEASGIAVDPTGQYVAAAFRGQILFQGNTKILNASNGDVVANLDLGLSINGSDVNHDDTDVAWDAVGNIYYTDASVGVWRAFSPPGTNQATTVALPMIHITLIISPLRITNITVAGTTVTLQFTGDVNDSISALHVLSAAVVTSNYVPVTAATITGSGGVFQATLPVNGPTRFYRISR